MVFSPIKLTHVDELEKATLVPMRKSLGKELVSLLCIFFCKFVWNLGLAIFCISFLVLVVFKPLIFFLFESV